MCTGFVKKGNDLLFGFNLDIDPAVWNFDLYKNDRIFTVGIRVGKTLYYTHGVNREGHFSNLPYMNDVAHGKQQVGKSRERIDLLTDRYLRNQYSYNDILRILQTKAIVNIPHGSMHSLLADADGHVLLIEPAYGYRDMTDNFAVISNYPLLTAVEHYEPYFGKERYDRASEILSNAGDDFTAMDGIALLKEVRQEGQWATRISFVYSVGEKCVYYVLNNQFDKVETHRFSETPNSSQNI